MKFQNAKCAVTVPTFHFCLIIYRECPLDCNQPCAFARPLIEFRNSFGHRTKPVFIILAPAEARLGNLASLTKHPNTLVNRC